MAESVMGNAALIVREYVTQCQESVNAKLDGRETNANKVCVSKHC